MALIERRPGSAALPYRLINLVLGVWLFISAFAWPHTQAEMANTWILGIVVAVFALVALWQPPARYVNTAAAVWLFVSAFALPHNQDGTLWNNVLVAIAVFVITLLPSARAGVGSRPLGRMPPTPA